MALRKRTPQSALGDLLRQQFASNVRRLRKAAGMTQSELARRSGLGRVFINQVEGGHTGVNLETIAAIAAALGVRPALLISRRGVERSDDPAAPQEHLAGTDRRRAGMRG